MNDHYVAMLQKQQSFVERLHFYYKHPDFRYNKLMQDNINMLTSDQHDLLNPQIDHNWIAFFSTIFVVSLAIVFAMELICLFNIAQTSWLFFFVIALASLGADNSPRKCLNKVRAS